jgi:hypothetical protein
MANPANRDPAEGSRETVERELARGERGTSSQKPGKNPRAEAENPGGRPSDSVKGSASSEARAPQGQQAATMPKGH